MSGVTFDIPTIMDTIERKYGEWHELTFTTHDESFIRSCGSDVPIIEFDSSDELHTWIAKTCTELEEQDAEQRKIDDKINHESASFEPTDHH